MTRWLMLGLTLIGLALVFSTKSPGVLGLGLLLCLVGIVGFVFALAADRISANARPESSMILGEDFTRLRRRTAPPPQGEAGPAATKVFNDTDPPRRD